MTAQPTQNTFDAPNPKTLLGRDNGTHKLTYYQWGEIATKPVALCIHGMARNARDFDYLANALVSEGFTVIAVDIAGRGKSQYLANPKWYNYQLYCADIKAFIKHLSLENIHYIGTSMGGLIGMMLAFEDTTKHPENPIIKKLVINDIGAFIPKESLMRIGQYIGQNMEFDNLEEASKSYQKTMQTFGINNQEHWQHLIKHGFDVKDNGKYIRNYDPHIADAFRTKKGKQRTIPDMDFYKMWDKITTPTLIIRGKESDLLLAETAAKMAKNQNVESIVEFAGIGHAPMLMEDEQITQILQFLST